MNKDLHRRKLKWRQKIVSEQILKLFDLSQILNKILPDESKFTSLPGLGPTSMDTIGKSLRKSHSFITPQESQDAIMWSFKVYKKMCIHIYYIYTKICSNTHKRDFCYSFIKSTGILPSKLKGIYRTFKQKVVTKW